MEGAAMNVIALAGYSGAGKTTLVERLIPALKLQGQRVSVVKHAHHRFDIDHAGKDTWRHRQAGAFEVVVASDQRLALMREFEQPAQLSVHHLIAELYGGVDWVLVEGFRDCDLHKIEVWRPSLPGEATRSVLYPEDDFVCAIATDAPGQLPHPTGLPLLDLNDTDAIVGWLMRNAHRFEYQADFYV
jgi:molybdopterin-guanine dinucleotide biosynthesis protein B